MLFRGDAGSLPLYGETFARSYSVSKKSCTRERPPQKNKCFQKREKLCGRFGYVYFFFSFGGDGESEEDFEAKRGGGGFFKFLEVGGARVSEEGRRGGAHGAGRVSRGWGGLNLFFGAEMSTKKSKEVPLPPNKKRRTGKGFH